MKRYISVPIFTKHTYHTEGQNVQHKQGTQSGKGNFKIRQVCATVAYTTIPYSQGYPTTVYISVLPEWMLNSSHRCK